MRQHSFMSLGMPLARPLSRPLTVIIALGVLITGLLYVALYPPRVSGPTNISDISCSSFHTKFLVIANERGFNDSVDHGAPANYWPILCVHQGAMVNITVQNNSGEPHGFSIAHYFDQGFTIGVGQSLTFSFVATDPGGFLVACNLIFCSAHPWMTSGALVVK